MEASRKGHQPRKRRPCWGASPGSPRLLEPPRGEAEMPTSPQPLQLCCPQHRNTRWGRRSVPGHLLYARPCSGWEDPIRTNDHPQTTTRLPDSPHPSSPVWMRPDPLQEGDRPGTQALTLTHTSCPGRTGWGGLAEWRRGHLPPGQVLGLVGARFGSRGSSLHAPPCRGPACHLVRLGSSSVAAPKPGS